MPFLWPASCCSQGVSKYSSLYIFLRNHGHQSVATSPSAYPIRGPVSAASPLPWPFYTATNTCLYARPSTQTHVLHRPVNPPCQAEGIALKPQPTQARIRVFRNTLLQPFFFFLAQGAPHDTPDRAPVALVSRLRSNRGPFLRIGTCRTAARLFCTCS
jgi:hypothetical protein